MTAPADLSPWLDVAGYSVNRVLVDLLHNFHLGHSTSISCCVFTVASRSCLFCEYSEYQLSGFRFACVFP